MQEGAAWLQCCQGAIPCCPSRAGVGSPCVPSGWVWGLHLQPLPQQCPFPWPPRFLPMLEAFCRAAGRCFTFPETSRLPWPSVLFQQEPPASLLLPSRKEQPRETDSTADHSSDRFCHCLPSASPCTTSLRFLNMICPYSLPALNPRTTPRCTGTTQLHPWDPRGPQEPSFPSGPGQSTQREDTSWCRAVR